MARATPTIMMPTRRFSGDNYWPEEMRPETYYTPVDRGFEKRIAERLAYWARGNRQRRL
jgi:putative ATPase